MKFREFELKKGLKILLGKDSDSNDSLVSEFKGKENTILHTSAPGSPFGVIVEGKPTKDNLNLGGAIVASYSQDWRDHKRDVSIDVFTGKDVSKPWFSKQGSWKVKNSKKIKVKKVDIQKIERKFKK